MKRILIIEMLGVITMSCSSLMAQERSTPFFIKGSGYQSIQGQERAVAEIRKLGGEIIVDKQNPKQTVTGVDFRDTKVTNADLIHLRQLPDLELLLLFGTGITDAGLAYLKDLSNLRSLILNQTGATSNGFEHLKRLTKLRVLDLFNCKVTDDGLAYLKELTQLEELYLFGTLVSDAGLVHLKGLTRLRFLKLQGTRATCQELVTFVRLGSLFRPMCPLESSV